jgi:hypothetical protein
MPKLLNNNWPEFPKPYWSAPQSAVWQGNVTDVLKTFPPRSVQCVVTSPPYWGLRDYGTAEWIGGNPQCNHSQAVQKGRADYGFSEACKKQSTNPHAGFTSYKRECSCGAKRIDNQLGAEPTPDCGTLGKADCKRCFVCNMVAVFRGVYRVLRDDGILWLNLGDSYSGSGKGRNADGTHNSKAGDKQHTNKGSTAGILQSYRPGAGKIEGFGANRDGTPAIPNMPGGNLVGIPWRVALALQANGWVLRAALPCVKRNAMPESTDSRPSKAVEDVFLLTKGMDYYFDMGAISPPAIRQRINGESAVDSKLRVLAGNEGFSGQGCGVTESRQFRTSDLYFLSLEGFDVPVANYKGAHFATFPPRLIEPMILAGVPYGGIVLDPFVGSGTTPATAISLGRKGLGIDLNETYLKDNAIPRIQEAIRVGCKLDPPVTVTATVPDAEPLV